MLHIYYSVYLGLTSELTENSATSAFAPTAPVMNTDEMVQEKVQGIQYVDAFEGMIRRSNHVFEHCILQMSSLAAGVSPGCW